MCVNCIRSDVDISDGIPKQATIHFCKGCDRYLQPPSIWIKAELESRELLALCLKKLRGLSKVRLVDAGFIWTEPHSRRIKVKLTIQKEVLAATILQQVFVVEYIVAGQYCEDCARVDAQLTWKAVVQLRQKVTHKRTFLWLEQLILKHNAHKDTNSIKEFRDGLDFYYSQRTHAIRMTEFLASVVPLRLKTSEQIVSSDEHSSVADFKYTYSVELVPICRDDLVCLSPKTARQLSNISPIALCTRVSNCLTLFDPSTARHSELRSNAYWDTPFLPLCEAKDLVEFYVIDIQPEQQTGKFMVATAEVAKSTDLSVTFLVRTHLGFILNAGDHAKGYILANANFNNDNFDAMLHNNRQAGNIPDVVLVRKSYPNARKKLQQRNWKIKKMVKAEGEEPSGRNKTGNSDAADYELFLRDVEEDPELRAMINLYKSDNQSADAGGAMMQVSDEDDEEPEEDFPQINVDDLLEDMEEMKIDDQEDDIVLE